MPQIRSAGLRGFRATVAELGGDADSYARRAGLSTAALDSDDLLVPDDAVARILEIASQGTACPDLGLRIAARQDLGMLGALALAIQHSPTVGDALECTSRYLLVHAQALSLTLETDPYGAHGVSALTYGLPPGIPEPRQGTDLALGFLHRAIIFLVGPYGLRSVELSDRPVAPLGVYEAFFGAPVRTGRPAPALRLPSSLASRRLDGRDARLRDLALAFLAEQAPQAENDIVQRVRATLTQTLGTAQVRIGTVADLLNLHPRTLQRHLRRKGTHFVEVLDEVRREAVSRYLTSTDIPMNQVAGLVGLSEQAALTHCCHRWWGTTPTDIRRKRSSAV